MVLDFAKAIQTKETQLKELLEKWGYNVKNLNRAEINLSGGFIRLNLDYFEEMQ